MPYSFTCASCAREWTDPYEGPRDDIAPKCPDCGTKVPDHACCSGCGDSGDTLYLHSKCHEDVPTWTKLEFEGGVPVRAVVECAECDKVVAILPLAPP